VSIGSHFKALRARFQEEALLAQSKTSRPAVSEKPKHLLPPGGHSSSVVSSINIAVENETPVVPRVIFSDGLRASGGKRPISFPPQLQQTSPPSQPANGDRTTRQSLKDRHMPLVLPVLPHKLDPEPGKEVPPHTKIKKKGLLLPFKSAKASKVSAENGEEPTYADLTTRPSSAPGALLSVEKQTTEDGLSFESYQSTAEVPLHSHNIPITPPLAETSVDSNNKFISTLEKAKKKFSRRQMLISAKPKSLRSPDYASRDMGFPLPQKNIIEPKLPRPSPVCLPPMACLSARPFCKVNHSFGWDKSLPSDRTGEPHSSSAPRKRPLPDLRLLGPLPPKPHRPPSVDLSCYLRPTVNGMLTYEEPEAEHPSVAHSGLDNPEFPDFEISEMETAEGEAVDIGALELETFDLVSTDLPVQDVCRLIGFEEPQPDLLVCDPFEPLMRTGIQNLNLGSQNIIPLDPASFPEPINFSAFPDRERQSPPNADLKEQKKREKHRLEKEKKEQKEREKKEHEMKKKFKVTGEEEAMYHAKVMVGSKVRKNDLPVKSGDTVGIIRTTSCPKGKWLARDANHSYGYISVMNVELNIKEMLELGKKAQAAGRGGNLEGDTISIGSSALCLIKPMCFPTVTDDSEEWACEDETLSPSSESQ
uniref:Si:ch211-188c16.1 n=1 Tax=Cyclopterus lumpus TaxID=8103 RepID=A0A8C2XFM5_CYCLU